MKLSQKSVSDVLYDIHIVEKYCKDNKIELTDVLSQKFEIIKNSRNPKDLIEFNHIDSINVDNNSKQIREYANLLKLAHAMYKNDNKLSVLSGLGIELTDIKKLDNKPSSFDIKSLNYARNIALSDVTMNTREIKVFFESDPGININEVISWLDNSEDSFFSSSFNKNGDNAMYELGDVENFKSVKLIGGFDKYGNIVVVFMSENGKGTSLPLYKVIDAIYDNIPGKNKLGLTKQDLQIQRFNSLISHISKK